ncbi:hypothetical protein VP01_962g5 [Puccinia sorghi]|uniref:Uncharacterized protein n=1 Tax=Puccinia sorghi TaxID=27349 RepID=A0A0L6U891_9BASI|nr:hypothetical protein VP01_962g5 [Puccinia sorghi]
MIHISRRSVSTSVKHSGEGPASEGHGTASKKWISLVKCNLSEALNQVGAWVAATIPLMVIMNSLRLSVSLFLITTLILSLCTSASKKHKCRATLNSDANGNSWERPNLKWKSPKHQQEGIVEATVFGRLETPTGSGWTTLSHTCYATLKVDLKDCSIVMSKNLTSNPRWSAHKSPIYYSQTEWNSMNWNETVSFRADCPESIHVEVFEP